MKNFITSNDRRARLVSFILLCVTDVLYIAFLLADAIFYFGVGSLFFRIIFLGILLGVTFLVGYGFKIKKDLLVALAFLGFFVFFVTSLSSSTWAFLPKIFSAEIIQKQPWRWSYLLCSFLGSLAMLASFVFVVLDYFLDLKAVEKLIPIFAIVCAALFLVAAVSCFIYYAQAGEGAVGYIGQGFNHIYMMALALSMGFIGSYLAYSPKQIVA